MIIDATWNILISQDSIDTEVVPVPIEKYHGRGPQRGVIRRVIEATYLRRKR